MGNVLNHRSVGCNDSVSLMQSHKTNQPPKRAWFYVYALFFIHFLFFLAYTFNNARIDSVVASQYSPVDKQAMPCKFITLYLQGPGRREVMPKTGNSLKKWR